MRLPYSIEASLTQEQQDDATKQQRVARMCVLKQNRRKTGGIEPCQDQHTHRHAQEAGARKCQCQELRLKMSPWSHACQYQTDSSNDGDAVMVRPINEH